MNSNHNKQIRNELLYLNIKQTFVEEDNNKIVFYFNYEKIFLNTIKSIKSIYKKNIPYIKDLSEIGFLNHPFTNYYAVFTGIKNNELEIEENNFIKLIIFKNTGNNYIKYIKNNKYNTFIIILPHKEGIYYKALNTNSFISQLKFTFSQNKKNIISLIKSLEYKEYFSRMEEKISKIDNLNLKKELVKALYLSCQEKNLSQNDNYDKIMPIIYLLKKSFFATIEKDNKHPSTFTLFSKAQEIIEYANKYKVILCKKITNISKINPLEYYNKSLLKESPFPNSIKNILAFGPREPHMIPIFEYIDIRLSRTIRFLISKANEQGKNTEIFIGSENQMLAFYTHLGYELLAHLKTNSSLAYYFFINKNNPNFNKIVILGIGNETKLNHLLILLKLSDINIDLDKIIIRGNLENFIHENKTELENIIDNIEAKTKIKIDSFFLGNRSLILLEFAKIKYPNEMRDFSNQNKDERKNISFAERILKEKHNLQTYEIGNGVYKFSYFEFSIRLKKSEKEKKLGIIAFRMPNGSLAKIVTEIFLERKINHFIRVGAGGSLCNLSQVGSYQLIKSTCYNKNKIMINELGFKEMKKNLNEIPVLENGNNITLDSPLIETRNWMNKVKNSKNNFTSVDVETYHIIKGIKKYSKKFGNKTEFLLGIFISDVVGNVPLVEKIKYLNAWKYLPKLFKICFEYIEKKSHKE